WTFDAKGGVLAGMPVDLLLAWVCLWGAVPALACPSGSLWPMLAGAFALDLVLMPLANPVVRLGPNWLSGELVSLVVVLTPAQLLARWTSRGEHLAARACLQVVAFTLLLFVVLPVVIIEASGSKWANPLTWPVWQLSIAAQLLAGVALFGLTAVQEFVTRGGGTPVPFDPSRRPVTTGIYAYISNPMQLAAAVLLVMWGAILENVWVAAGG